MEVTTTPKGERVILDPSVTIQRIYMIFYLCINVGSLSLLATPYMEKYIGFWSAYLLAFCMFCAGVAVLILGRNKYVVRPPQGSVITVSYIGPVVFVTRLTVKLPSGRIQVRLDNDAPSEPERPEELLPSNHRRPDEHAVGRSVC